MPENILIGSRGEECVVSHHDTPVGLLQDLGTEQIVGVRRRHRRHEVAADETQLAEMASMNVADPVLKDDRECPISECGDLRQGGKDIKRKGVFNSPQSRCRGHDALRMWLRRNDHAIVSASAGSIPVQELDRARRRRLGGRHKSRARLHFPPAGLRADNSLLQFLYYPSSESFPRPIEEDRLSNQAGGGSYRQFCPIAMASEIVCSRWTALVLREMLCGSTHFNDLRRGVPRMSPTLLSKRLKELEQVGVIAQRRTGRAGGAEYELTEAGKDLRGVIMSLGLWGHRWIEFVDLAEESSIRPC